MIKKWKRCKKKLMIYKNKSAKSKTKIPNYNYKLMKIFKNKKISNKRFNNYKIKLKCLRNKFIKYNKIMMSLFYRNRKNPKNCIKKFKSYNIKIRVWKKKINKNYRNFKMN
jgi:hypothetical protein